MNAWDWIVAILLFALALTFIITIHELGHLAMAKLFKVYCQEFSIGFGPALIHTKGKGKETYFSLRVFPIGGYVSMYGEEMELEDGVTVPPSRSLEGIRKWKKAIIVSAGIICNIVLAFILIFVSNVAFPLVKTTGYAKVSQDSIAYVAGIRDDYKLQITHSKDFEIKNEDGSTSIQGYALIYDDNGKSVQEIFFIVDTTVVYKDIHYVLAYYPTTTKHDNNLSECLRMYVGLSKEEVAADEDFASLYGNWTKEENAPEYYPNFRKRYNFENDEFTANLSFNVAKSGEEPNVQTFPIKITSENGKINDLGLSLKIVNEWLPFNVRMQNTFTDFGNATVAIFNGIANLFTSGFKNMSGIIGIFTTSTQLYGSYTFANYLYLWGLISINLAIFNLLPFPGLDGWQLLVTAVEGITRKKIPNKVKSIITVVGLVLIFALMVVVSVMDILRIIGVL